MHMLLTRYRGVISGKFNRGKEIDLKYKKVNTLEFARTIRVWGEFQAEDIVHIIWV